jgi:hypothetical protein
MSGTVAWGWSIPLSTGSRAARVVLANRRYHGGHGVKTTEITEDKDVCRVLGLDSVFSVVEPL